MPGQLAALLNKHPVAVSRWVSDSARQRQEVSAFGVAMDKRDEALSGWALEASKRGDLAREFAENQEQNDFVNFVSTGTDADVMNLPEASTEPVEGRDFADGDQGVVPLEDGLRWRVEDQTAGLLDRQHDEPGVL